MVQERVRKAGVRHAGAEASERCIAAPLHAPRAWFNLLHTVLCLHPPSQLAGKSLQSQMMSPMLPRLSAGALHQAAANQLSHAADLADAFMRGHNRATDSLDAWYDSLPC